MWTNSRLLAQGSRWLAQGSRWKKKKKQVQKVSRKEKKQVQKVSRKEKSKCRKLAGRKNEKCESLFVCVCTTRTDWPTVCLCFPHENTVRSAPPKHPSTQWLSWMHWNSPRPRLFLRPRQPQRETLNEQARAARVTEGERDAAGCCTD